MEVRDRLAQGDDDAWNEVFPPLFAVAFAVAKSQLRDRLSSECEDVAMETLSEIAQAKSRPITERELKKLTAAIALNKAKDRIRRHSTAKRGGKITESLEEISDPEHPAES